MTENFLLQEMGALPQAVRFVEQAQTEIESILGGFSKTAEYNAYKVLEAFRSTNVAARHFAPSTGYGYSDEGREKLAALFARIFRTETAIVSPLIASGTHAISIALFGLLRPLDTMLCVSGTPYDTLHSVIGLENEQGSGSLADYAIKYQQVDLLPAGQIDIQRTLDYLRLNKSIRMVYLQRSRGYAWRNSLGIRQIQELAEAVKQRHPQVYVVVDNCYGEFTEPLEPTEVGVDLIVGSLIKNPGGGLAPTGAYLAGTAECIDKCAARLTCAGIGTEVGSYLAGYLPYFQGIYLAPQAVGNALKGAALTAYVFQKLGYQTSPAYNQPRTDITQAVRLHNEEELLALVRAVQKASPVDSNVVPYPWDMPGYQHQVIMAAGTFIQGGSLELSADAPLREPYIAYMQGGLTFENVKLALMLALSDMNCKLE